MIDLFSQYAWPGNIRELRNTIERMMVLSREDRLTLADVPQSIVEAVQAGQKATATPVALTGEAAKIRAALIECKGNRTATAKALGIPLRTLYRRLKSYGLEDFE